MHDDIILSYTMDFENKSMTMITYNESTNVKSKFYADGVLTYYFENALEHNIVFSIEEADIRDFYGHKEDVLKKNVAHCWPIIYSERAELEEFLVEEGYKYIILYSSYGMSGWILAKAYEITQMAE